MTFAEAYNRLNEDDRYVLDERAAILEFDAGLSRAEAEVKAVTEFLYTKFLEGVSNQ
jgi:hypothetical protein